jgi:YbbR domain-containing protein
MPFQDIDEVSTSEPQRAPSSIEKLLRKIFVEDWNLKLLSLAITLVLWLVVTGQNEPVTAHVNVQLNFIRPQTLEISNDPPKTVDVMLTGSRNKLDDLSSLDLVATVDISDQRAGERVLRLSDKAVISLPQGVKIDGFQPSAVPVRLEPIVDRQLQIEPKLEGKPADGYEVYGVTPVKPVVLVRGPASRVYALQTARTESIWLSGNKESFTAQSVAIDIADPKVDLLDPVIDVDVEIGPKRVEKTFPEIEVTGADGAKISPAVTSVTVAGPPDVIARLQANEVKILIDGNGDSLVPRLVGPSGVQHQLLLKSLTPAKFVRTGSIQN